jgi:hypothetical protein
MNELRILAAILTVALNCRTSREGPPPTAKDVQQIIGDYKAVLQGLGTVHPELRPKA